MRKKNTNVIGNFNRLKSVMDRVFEESRQIVYRPDEIECDDLDSARAISVERNYLSRGGFIQLFGEFDGRLYDLLFRVNKHSLIEHRQAVVRWLGEGKLVLGHVNRMKYKGKEIEI